MLYWRVQKFVGTGLLIGVLVARAHATPLNQSALCELHHLQVATALAQPRNLALAQAAHQSGFVSQQAQIEQAIAFASRPDLADWIYAVPSEILHRAEAAARRVLGRAGRLNSSNAPNVLQSLVRQGAGLVSARLEAVSRWAPQYDSASTVYLPSPQMQQAVRLITAAEAFEYWIDSSISRRSGVQTGGRAVSRSFVILYGDEDAKHAEAVFPLMFGGTFKDAQLRVLPAFDVPSGTDPVADILLNQLGVAILPMGGMVQRTSTVAVRILHLLEANDRERGRLLPPVVTRQSRQQALRDVFLRLESLESEGDRRMALQYLLWISHVMWASMDYGFTISRTVAYGLTSSAENWISIALRSNFATNENFIRLVHRASVDAADPMASELRRRHLPANDPTEYVILGHSLLRRLEQFR